MSRPTLGKVPARYIGQHEVQLAKFGAPYFDADGKPLKSLILRHGDTLMVNEGEVRGESWLHDPQRLRESLHLGSGKKVLPEHAGLSPEEWEALGYEHHSGRTDFEEIIDANSAPTSTTVPAQDLILAETPQDPLPQLISGKRSK